MQNRYSLLLLLFVFSFSNFLTRILSIIASKMMVTSSDTESHLWLLKSINIIARVNELTFLFV